MRPGTHLGDESELHRLDLLLFKRFRELCKMALFTFGCCQEANI